MRIYGERNMPGAGGNLAGTPSFQIGPRSPFKGMSQEELNKLKEWDSRPGELQKYYEQQNRPGPSLPFPFANLPGAIGNVGGLMAQLPPAGGNAGSLGGPMMMQSPYGNKPLNIDINAVDQGIESVGGSANIQLDDNQLLRLGGSFNPAGTNQMGMQSPQSFSIYGNYETPGFGLNVNYRNTGGKQQTPGGFPGEIQAGFGTRFR